MFVCKFVLVLSSVVTGAGFSAGQKNFTSMFSLWADVGGESEMGKLSEHEQFSLKKTYDINYNISSPKDNPQS